MVIVSINLSAITSTDLALRDVLLDIRDHFVLKYATILSMVSIVQKHVVKPVAAKIVTT